MVMKLEQLNFAIKSHGPFKSCDDKNANKYGF